jgi:hypothetical protein
MAAFHQTCRDRFRPIADIRNIADATVMSRFPFVVAFVLAAQSASVSGQLNGTTTHAGCITVSKARPTVSAKGRLTLRHMPGPPNFESIRQGDEDRLTLILVLPESVCIDDGGDFADPKKRFTTVHIWSQDPTVGRTLKESVGKVVTVTGDGYASNNAMHYAPLVLEAKSVIVPQR